MKKNSTLKTMKTLTLNLETLRTLSGGEPVETGKVSPRPAGTEETANITNPYLSCN